MEHCWGNDSISLLVSSGLSGFQLPHGQVNLPGPGPTARRFAENIGEGAVSSNGGGGGGESLRPKGLMVNPTIISTLPHSGFWLMHLAKM